MFYVPGFSNYLQGLGPEGVPEDPGVYVPPADQPVGLSLVPTPPEEPAPIDLGGWNLGMVNTGPLNILSDPGPAYDENMVYRFDTGNRVGVPDGQGGWTYRNAAPVVFQPGQTYVMTDESGQNVIARASTPEEMQRLVQLSQDRNNWALYQADASGNYTPGTQLSRRSNAGSLTSMLLPMAGIAGLGFGLSALGLGAGAGGAAAGGTGAGAGGAAAGGTGAAAGGAGAAAGGTGAAVGGGLAAVAPEIVVVGAPAAGIGAGGAAALTGGAIGGLTQVLGGVQPGPTNYGGQVYENPTPPGEIVVEGVVPPAPVPPAVPIGGLATLPTLTPPQVTPPDPTVPETEGTGWEVIAPQVNPPVLPPIGDIATLGGLTTLVPNIVPQVPPAELPPEDIVVEGVRPTPPSILDVATLPAVVPPLTAVTPPEIPITEPPPADGGGFSLADLSHYLNLAGLGIGALGSLFGGRGGNTGGGPIPTGWGGLSPGFGPGLPPPNLPGLGGTGGGGPRTPTELGGQGLSSPQDWYRYGYGPEQSFYGYVPQNPANTSKAYTGYAEGGFAVQGPGDGREDKIPAMLSDGEYVIDAETVALLGNGSNRAGAKLLDKFRVNVRKHKGRDLARGGFSKNAKKPEHYLAGGRTK